METWRQRGGEVVGSECSELCIFVFIILVLFSVFSKRICIFHSLIIALSFQRGMRVAQLRAVSSRAVVRCPLSNKPFMCFDIHSSSFVNVENIAQCVLVQYATSVLYLQQAAAPN